MTRKLSGADMAVRETVDSQQATNSAGSPSGGALERDSHPISPPTVRRASVGDVGQSAMSWISAKRDMVRRRGMLPPGEKRPDSVEGVNLLVIHPERLWKSMFDLLVAACILYTSVVAPVQVFYRISFLEETEVLVDVVLFLDIVLQFFHSFSDHGYPVFDLKRVARRYARSWFVVDLLLVSPSGGERRPPCLEAAPHLLPWVIERLGAHLCTLDHRASSLEARRGLRSAPQPAPKMRPLPPFTARCSRSTASSASARTRRSTCSRSSG